MLPSELLFSRRRGLNLTPRFLPDRDHPWAAAVLATITAHQHQTRAELNSALRALEGDSPDYRLIRGFAHLALAQAELMTAQPENSAAPEPEVLRAEVFAAAAAHPHGFGETQTECVLAPLCEQYGLTSEVLRETLYADLPERQVLTVLPDFTAASLVDRYNLAQAQGVLYSALYLRLNAHRNVPGEYQKLFQRLKFHGLMYAVEGHLADGYQIYVDGPASLFKQTRKYGIQMAVFLPALLNVTRWELTAVVLQKGRELTYRLSSEAPLRSHYPKPPDFDSQLERAFAARWAKLDTPWQLEREVEIVDLKGTVFLPDFALRHPDGRIVHVEIVGFWHPDYLRRKLDKVHRAKMNNLILAVSDRLNVGEQALERIPGPVIFFKGKLEPKQVLALLDSVQTLTDSKG